MKKMLFGLIATVFVNFLGFSQETNLKKAYGEFVKSESYKITQILIDDYFDFTFWIGNLDLPHSLKNNTLSLILYH